MSEFEGQKPLPGQTRRVAINGIVGTVPVKIEAIMAPAEPDVGLMLPYPIAMDVHHLTEGHLVPISRAERLGFLAVLQTAYEILEHPHG